MANHQSLVSLIERPVSLSASHMDQYVTASYDLLVQLGDHGHWDNGALQGVAHLFATNVNDQNLNGQFSEWQKQRNIAGSPLFISLFQHSSAAPKERLSQLLTTLGGHLARETGDLIVDRSFDDELAPDAPFWQILAHAVQTTFPTNLSADEPFTRMIHQLRYVIDAHNVDYVRRNFQQPGKSDLEALIAFDKDRLAGGGKSSYASSSRMHNKQPEGLARGVLPALPNGNFKRVVNFHSEFIIAPVPVPTFITIPLAKIANVNDVPEYVRALTLEERNALVNGASFNYADANDYGEPNSIHERLDIDYGDNDPLVRRLAIKPYVSPRAEPRVISMLQEQYDHAVTEE